MEYIMKKILIILSIMLGGSSFAQLGVNAGTSMLKGFGQPRPWGGLHFGIEIPRDDAVSIYGRVTHHFKQQNQDSIYTNAIARDVSTTPYTIQVSGVSSMNYTVIEGGTRYYLGDGYDFGWAAYGGTNLSLIFNGVKTQYFNFDETLYELQSGADRKGTIFSLAFGLGGGVKYSMEEIGTLYFDLGLNYVIFGQASNETAYIQLQQDGLYRSLLFNFNLGFRRDLTF